MTENNSNAYLDQDGKRFKDAVAAERLARDVMEYLCWSNGLGWLHYNGKHWQQKSDAFATEVARKHVKLWYELECQQAADRTPEEHQEALKGAVAMFQEGRINAITRLARGLLEKPMDMFEFKHWMLNCQNGTVDLRTGVLQPHDFRDGFMSITACNYVEGAVHDDWVKALGALPTEVADYMQVRIGQAITGYMTPDDVIPFLKGDGANAKTTFLGAIEQALGTFVKKVPDKLLIGNNNEHPTIKMTLKGARLAIIEETPEARHLDVKALKDLAGSPTITAHLMHKDWVEFDATHSLMVTTNYIPRVDEVDHGTWRRLAMIRFPYTYVDAPTRDHERQKDGELRDRLLEGTGGRHEAVLAWAVAGAQRWFAANKRMPSHPEQVAMDTMEWRSDADLIYAFVSDGVIEFDENACIRTTDLLKVFNEWLTQRSARPWSEGTIASRFESHPLMVQNHVTKERTAKYPPVSMPKAYAPAWEPASTVTTKVEGRQRVWLGIKFA